MNLSGNTILITGGATGIGFALAEHLIKAGNAVVICGRRREALESARARLPEVDIVACDISEEFQRIQLIERMFDERPDLNVLVNNAGIEQEIWLTSPVAASIIAREISTNLTAPIHLTSLVGKHFATKAEAAIVNITSGLGFVPLARYPVYGATKAALHSFSITSRHQFKSTPVKIFEIIPPTVETELDQGRRAASGRQLTIIQPEEVAIATLKALAEDNFECAIGQAADLRGASRSENAELVFERMNG